MGTYRDLINSAGVSSGILGAAEFHTGFSATESDIYLRKLNGLLDQLTSDPSWKPTFASYLKTAALPELRFVLGSYLTPGDPDVIAVVNRIPVIVESVSYRKDTVRTPLLLQTPAQFYAKELTTETNAPECFWYDAQNGQLFIYPAPDQTYEFQITTTKDVLDYTLNDLVALPTGYEPYLEAELAVMMARMNGYDITMLQQDAMKAKRIIDRINAPKMGTPVDASFGAKRTYDNINRKWN